MKASQRSLGDGSLSANRTIRRIPIWVVGAFAAFGLLALLGGLILDVVRADQARNTALAWRKHSYEVIIAANALSAAVQGAETGQRGFLLTGDPAFRSTYNGSRATAVRELGALRQRLARDPDQAARYAEIAALAAERMQRLDRGMALLEKGQTNAALAFMRTGDGRRAMEAFQAKVADLAAREARLLAERAARADASAREARAGLIGAAAVGLMLNFVAGILGLSAYRSKLDDAREEGSRGTYEKLYPARTSLSEVPVNLPVRGGFKP